MTAESPTERAAFIAVFDQIREEILTDLDSYSLPQAGKNWIASLLSHSVPGGKLNRGLTVVSSLTSLISHPLTKKEKDDAYILGWCIELLQACFLIADDIMDQSIMRRGVVCWYKRPEVGLVAINDAFIL